MILNDWADQCWSLLSVRPRTLADYRCKFRHNIAPTLGHLPMGEITRADIQRWMLTLSPTVGRAALPILMTLYREAIEYGIVDTSPVRRIKRKPHIAPERDFRTLDELKAMDFGNHSGLFMFMAQHGVRWSECRALTEADIHGGFVHITKSAEGLPTKSGRGRKVPYAGGFEDFPKSYKHSRLKLRDVAGVTIHSLRYSYAYELKRRGVHIGVAQRLLGHSTVELSIGLYTRVLDSELEDAGRLMAAPVVAAEPCSVRCTECPWEALSNEHKAIAEHTRTGHRLHWH